MSDLDLDLDAVASRSKRSSQELKQLRAMLIAVSDALDYLHGLTPEQASALRKDAERYRWLADHARSTAEHWGGRWSLVIDGPAPERHDCVVARNEAVDAAMAMRAGGKQT